MIRTARKLTAIVLTLLLLFQTLSSALALEDMPEYIPDRSQDITNDISFTGHITGEEEIISDRTKYSKRYITSSGTYREEVYHEPIHYLKDGKWEEIDKSLIEKDSIVENKSNDFKFQLKKVLPNGFQQIGKGQNQILFRPLFVDSPVKAEITDGAVMYPNVTTDTDLQYQSKSTGLKEVIVLKSKDAPNQFQFEFNIKSLSFIEKNGDLFFKDSSGKELFILEKPVIIDRATEEEVVHYQIEEQDNNKFIFTITVDPEWLQQQEEFPILLDPTITTKDSQNTTSTFVAESFPTTSYDNWSHFYVGRGDDLGKTRALINFILPHLPSGAQINNANLVLDNTQVYSQYQNPIINLSRITSSWSQSYVNWSNQPTTGPVQHTKQLLASESGIISLPMTSIVQDWYDGADNLGVQLKYSNETELLREFLSENSTSNTIGVPYIEIEYSIDGLGLQPFWTYDGSVNMANRNFVQTFTDINYPGKNVQLTTQRTYNSRSTTTGTFGYGWSSIFDMRLYTPANGPAKLIDQTGTNHYFHFDSQGQYESPEGLYLQLYLNSTTRAQIVTQDQTIFEFNIENGKLLKIEYANDNFIQINYNGDTPLSMEDSTGQKISLTIENGLLTGATDPAGRMWNYNYSGNLLTQVIAPDQGISHYAYDNGGRLVRYTSPAGRTTYFSHTEASRLTAINPVNGVINSNFEVDSNGDGLVDHFQFGYGNDEPLNYEESSGSPFGSSVSIAVDQARATSWNYTYYLSDPIYIDGTKNHTLSSWVKAAETSGTLQTIISIIVYDKNGQNLGEFGRMEREGSFEWERMNTLITDLPDTAYRAHVKLAVKEVSGAGKTYFDAIQLEEGDNPSEFVSGDQITASVAAQRAARYDGEGRKILYIYNEHQNITQQTIDPDGKSLTTLYEWDSTQAHVLKSVTDPKLNKWSFGVDPETGNITQITDPKGNIEGYQWDGQSNLTDYIDVNNESYQMTYDDKNQQWTHRDPYFRTQATEYENGNVKSVSPMMGLAENLVANGNFESDSTGVPDSWTISGGQINNVTIRPDGYYGGNSVTIDNSINDSFPYSYLESNKIYIDPNEDYVLSARAKTEGIGQQVILSVYAYNSTGSRVELGRIEYQDILGWNELKTVIQSTEIPDDIEYVRVKMSGKNVSSSGTSIFDGIQFQKYAISTPFNLINNASFEMDEDLNNWPDQWTTASGVYSISTTESFAGDTSIKISNANESKAITPIEYLPVTDQDYYHFSTFVKTVGLQNVGTYIKFEFYDGNKDIIHTELQIESEKVGEDTPWRRLTLELKPEDIPAGTAYIRPCLIPASGSGTTFFDNVRLQEGNWNTTFGYDSSQRWLKIITGPYGETNKFTYATVEDPTHIGDPRVIEDIYGNITNIDYKPGTNLEEKITTKNGVMEYKNKYNDDGDPLKYYRLDTENGKKVTTKISYNKLGQVASYTDVIGIDDEESTETNDQVTQFFYTPSGLLKQLIKPDGDQVDYKYNNLGQLISISYDGVERFQYSYDENWNQTKVIDLENRITTDAIYDYNGLLTNWTNERGSFSYVRDKQGNLIEQTFTTGVFSRTESLTYNKIGQPKTFRDSRGNTSEILFNEAGQLDWYRTGTLFESHMDYQQNGLVTTMTNRHFSSGNLISQYTYTYDDVTHQNVRSITDNNGNKREYLYDPYNQLETETLDNGTEIHYTYYKDGNRKSKTIYDSSGNPIRTEDYVYGDANQLTNVGSTSRSYNVNGQLETDGQFIYEWNTAGNLSRVYDQSTGLMVAEYRYDDLNRRIEQVVDGELTKFVYDGGTNHVIAELDAYDQVKKYYTWSPAGHLESIEENGIIYYPVRNGQGDIVEILNEEGTPVATYTYDAFGTLVDQSGQTNISPYRYAGYRYDEITGMYYLMDRYYQPEVGQFISVDSESKLPDYSYGLNNPLKYNDPDGKKPKHIALEFPGIGGKSPSPGRSGGNYEGSGQLSVDLLDEVESLMESLPAPKIHKHHIFPQQYREWFEDRGIDIDQLSIPLERSTHLSGVHGKGGFIGPGSVNLNGKWNQRWDKFIRANPNATPKEIYQYAGKLIDEFGLNNIPIIPYR